MTRKKIQHNQRKLETYEIIKINLIIIKRYMLSYLKFWQIFIFHNTILLNQDLIIMPKNINFLSSFCFIVTVNLFKTISTILFWKYRYTNMCIKNDVTLKSDPVKKWLPGTFFNFKNYSLCHFSTLKVDTFQILILNFQPKNSNLDPSLYQNQNCLILLHKFCIWTFFFNKIIK